MYRVSERQSYDCVLCGRYVTWKLETLKSNFGYMRAHKICSTCADWNAAISNSSIKIDEKTFAAYTEKSPGRSHAKIQGVRYLSLEDGKVHHKDFWHLGLVPMNFRSKVKPNIRILRNHI